MNPEPIHKPRLPPEEVARRRRLLSEAIGREHVQLARRLRALIWHRHRNLGTAEQRQRADELLQDTVERALRDAHAYDPALPAMPWLLHLACFVLGDQNLRHRREASRHGEAGVDDLVLGALPGAGDGELPLIAACDAALVRRKLQELPEPKRRIVMLRFYEGKDGQELAALSGAPTSGAARIRLTRALQALRAAFLAQREVSR